MKLKNWLCSYTFGAACTGKSYLVKTIYQPVSKDFLHHVKGQGQLRILLFWPTWISAVDISGITMNSAIGIGPVTGLCKFMKFMVQVMKFKKKKKKKKVFGPFFGLG